MISRRIQHGASSLRLYPDGPDWEGRNCATLGAFEFASVEEGIDLIRLALSEIDAPAVLAPMNGDSWHPYRVVTESDGRAPFAMEPVSGPYDLSVLRAAGFTGISNYASTIGLIETAIQGPPIQVPGVEIEAWDGQNGEALVDHIFALSEAGFAQNKFFKPIDLEAFRALYRPLIAGLDPRFVLLAHSQGRTVGFAFGYPTDAQTVVLKTYASGVRGVGHALADGFHRAGRQAGFTHIIHALMQAENRSLAHSRLHGLEVFRRYALLGRVL